MPQTLMWEASLLEKDLGDRTYIVTGANSGSGLATAQQLAQQGAHVVAACRRVDAAEAAFKDLDLRGSVEVMALDLASLASVRGFAEAFLSKYSRLDGLVNNAGVMAVPQGLTEDGFETQFGVNHLGHFLLTELLLDILKASAPARIVCVSSVAHAGMRGIYGEIDFDDLHFEQREYEPYVAYAQSKFANVLHALELARRLEGTGVSAFSVHPGWIRSNLVESRRPGSFRTSCCGRSAGRLGRYPGSKAHSPPCTASWTITLPITAGSSSARSASSIRIKKTNRVAGRWNPRTRAGAISNWPRNSTAAAWSWLAWRKALNRDAKNRQQ